MQIARSASHVAIVNFDPPPSVCHALFMCELSRFQNGDYLYLREYLYFHLVVFSDRAVINDISHVPNNVHSSKMLIENPEQFKAWLTSVLEPL